MTLSLALGLAFACHWAVHIMSDMGEHLHRMLDRFPQVVIGKNRFLGYAWTIECQRRNKNGHPPR